MTTHTDHSTAPSAAAPSTDLGELRRQLAVLHGGKVTSVHVPGGDAGLFALLLGLPDPRPDGPAELAHRWLTVARSGWTLDRPTTARTTPGPGARHLADDLRALIGREITAVRITEPGWDTLIEFGDHHLRIHPAAPALHTPPDETPAWALRLPSRHLLLIGPGPRWRTRH
ncbi:hypothetical protein K353_00051 [Kitasatospora sp. SolWspMP-SS2h]|uniref:hypothetical protein n=1 Tax=Kitasatospora sp. SolWspMP-SS2h TaxID=1305729 RepID=UPI000DBA641B|nr:hypothetical protein [Kitasatospora sp. SolWspMP-SS2h]RAJ46850.1 hypothetical protein K353_00051 [Kitasatospora sp. SolWspMP-SS2h]